MAKQRFNITMETETRQRLLDYAEQMHIYTLSGILEYIAWHVIPMPDKSPSSVLEGINDTPFASCTKIDPSA